MGWEFVTVRLSMNLKVGRVTPCAPGFELADNGAHGVTRPTNIAGSWFRSAELRRDVLLMSAATDCWRFNRRLK